MNLGLPPSNNADQIIPNVWLGNLKAAHDETFLRNAGIQVVFNYLCSLNLNVCIIVSYFYESDIGIAFVPEIEKGINIE